MKASPSLVNGLGGIFIVDHFVGQLEAQSLFSGNFERLLVVTIHKLLKLETLYFTGLFLRPWGF